MNDKNNGKWQIAFWTLGIIATAGLIGLTNAVVANDRIRSVEDQRIEKKVEELRETINCQNKEIIQRLTRIETKMENK